MKRFKAQQIYLLFILILGSFLISGCGGDGDTTGHWFAPTATLMSIEVTPPNPSIAKGTTQQFMATGIYSNNSKVDMTASVNWTSSALVVATISNAAGSKGLATALSVGGPITIRATDPATGKTGTAALTVTAAALVSIGVTPINPTIARGTNQQFVATGIYTDATTQNLTSSVTWTSSAPTIATISNAAGLNGLATSLLVGITTITATSGAISGNTTLTVSAATLVSIAVTPVNRSIGLGTNQQFVATGTYTAGPTQDLTKSVTWTSSTPAVATISNAVGFNGLATSVAAGITTITATSGTISGATTLTVTPAALVSITVTPVNPSIALGVNQQFIATGIYANSTTQDLTSSVTWTSSAPAIATISNAAGSNGLATSLSAGITTITATFGAITGKTTLTVTTATLVSIAVTPANPSIARGTKQQFIARGTYTDGTTKILTSTVTWTSLTPTVATISNAAGSNGLATSLLAGTTTIRAALGLISGSTTLTVTAATLVSIAVTPANPSIAVTTTQQFIATGTFTAGPTQDLTSSVTWTSSAPAIATISNVAGSNGFVTSLSAGLTTITATDPSTAIAGSTTLTVAAATLVSIAVTPANPGITVGATQQYVATGTYTDATTKIITAEVTWTTTPLVSTVATIDNAAGFNGLATALSAGGPITITATDPVTLTAGTAQLTVTIAPNLKTAATFGGFGGGAGMTNQGILTVINGGDIGSTAVSTALTGFHDSTGDGYTETPLNIGDVKGRIYTAPPPPVIFGPGGPYGGTAVTMAIATAAAADALTAYNYLAGLPGGADPGAGQLGGLTLAPGTYTAAGGSFLLTGTDLTLNAFGDPNAVWVFQMATSLTVGAPGFPRNIILAGGAQAKNVFWQVGSAARIENRCNMVGTIIASAGVTISTAGELALTTLNGRALGLNASVTMVNTVVNVPAP